MDFDRTTWKLDISRRVMYHSNICLNVIELASSMRNFKTKVLTTEFEKKARLMKLAGEPARIRILCVLLAEPGACVSKIAEELSMSVAAVSHHLQLMQAGGLVSAKRRGKQVCYNMPIGKNLKYLRQFICQKE